jgi:hypothetical protein
MMNVAGSYTIAPTPQGLQYPTAEDRDRRISLRKAVLLPALMLALLSLVPVLRTEARYVFILALVPLILYSAFRDTELAIYSYISWCWMDGTIRGLLGGGMVTSLGRDIVLFLVVIGWAVQRLGSRRADPIRVPPATLLIVLFMVNCLIQIANPFSLGLISTLSGLKVQLAAIPLYFIAYDVFRRRDQVRSLAVFLTLATLAISTVALVQYSHGEAWTYEHYPGTKDIILTGMRADGMNIADADKSLFRPPGTTLIGGATGVFITLVMPLTFALLLARERFRLTMRQRAVLAVIFFVFIVTVLLGGLRIGIVQGVEGIAFCALLCGGQIRSRAMFAAMALVCLALVGYALTASLSEGALANRYASLFADPVEALQQDRQTFLEQLPDLAVSSPLGVGLGRTGAAAGYFGVQSYDIGFVAFSESYLGDEVLETGLIGATLATLIAATFLAMGFRVLRTLSDQDDKLLVAALLAILMTIFVDFFAMSVLNQPPGSVLYWLIAAVLARVYFNGLGASSKLFDGSADSTSLWRENPGAV